jgi:DNA-binding response OmpR family regulator
MKQKSIHLPSAMVQAIGKVADYVGEAQYSVVSEYPAHLPAIEANEDALIQVIASLVSYVVKSTRREEIRVRAELISAADLLQDLRPSEEMAHEIDVRGSWVVVSVSDVVKGTALRRRTIRDVAEETEDEAIGEAFTLDRCETLIHSFGGHLWIEGEAGDAIRLKLTLPLRATHRDDADVSDLRRAVETRLPESELVTHTIMLVVDDQTMRDLLTSELVGAGYRVIAPSSGGETLPSARSDQPDLILLDLLSRDPSALDIALVLKNDVRTQNIPVLFLTTISDPQGQVKMGAANFLIRPVGTGALLATVRTVLRSGLSPAARVLVVEPDEVARENMVMMIQAHGYRVTVATGPEEALAMAERVDPGLVLVNAKLAQERDYWLLRGLRHLSGEFDVFVLADALSDEEGKAAISRGASGYSETGDLADLLSSMRNKQNE